MVLLFVFRFRRCFRRIVVSLAYTDVTRQAQERLEARTYERIRIARDLRDTLLQGVQALVLRFHIATEQLPRVNRYGRC